MKFVSIEDAASIAHLGKPAGPVVARQDAMPLRIAGLVEGSITDGPGIRLVVFGQGCPHGCPECHNPESHAPAGGFETTVGAILKVFAKNPLYAGVTLSGGEPFIQARAMAHLAELIRQWGGSVVVYTGYRYEELAASEDASVRALLEQADLLIDGKYDRNQRSLDLLYRGSSNQRILLSL